MAVNESIRQSHTALKEYFSLSRRQESSGNPAQLVVFAEHAIKNGCKEIALDCVQLYFSLDPPVNQFQVRAYLCEALASSPQDPSQEELLAHSLSCILKAVSIAKKSECYHFLVYNASVLLWQICRPFCRPGSRRHYSKPLQTVVKALEDVKDQDNTWRLELMIGLILSQLDRGQFEDAAKISTSAVQLARKKAPEKLGELVRLYVTYNLGDNKIFDRDSKSFPEFNVLIRLYKAKSAIAAQKLSDSEAEQKLYRVLTNITVEEAPPMSGRKIAVRSSTPVPPPKVKSLLLLELGALAIENGLVKLTEDCLNALPQELVEHNVQLMIRRQVLSVQVLIREGYGKSAVEGRVQAVKRLDDILASTVRTSDMDLIQHVCVALWNASLPLLQPNLRHHLLKPLTAAATALEQIDSLLCQMRVGIHFELGKICADQGHLKASLEHMKKASKLDYFGEYKEQISLLENKVILRTQLYSTPEEPLQKAIKIIEQASVSSATGDELRSLLVKAGNLLAPDHFSQTLTRPSNISVNSLLSQISSTELTNETRAAIQDNSKKLASYSQSKQLVDEYLKVTDTQDRERCHVWSDLARVARKGSVWDVAIAAARFCVAYDDGRWVGSATKPAAMISERLSSPRLSQGGSAIPRNSSTVLQKSNSQLGLVKSQLSVPNVTHLESVESVKREEFELIRTLANTHCLLAECLVYYLKQEGLQLGEQPPLPDLPTGLNEQWSSYTNWLSVLSTDSIGGFLRAGELGVSLGEEVLVGNAAVYLWNYQHHWVKTDCLIKVVGAFKPLLAYMKQVNMSSDSVLLTRVCSALVRGIVQKWAPKPADDRPITAKKVPPGRSESRGKKGRSGNDPQIDPEAGPELKEALEVCEYCLSVWGTVPLSVRRELLTGWVACRQLLHQPFATKTFDIEEETKDPLTANCRAMIALGIVKVQGNGLWEFPNPPTLSEVSAMVSECQWGERLVELELWVQLAELALKQKDLLLAYQCANRAVGLKLPDITSDQLSSDERVGCELWSLAYSLQGQALLTSAAGNMSVLRQALEAFYNSVRFAHKASSYSLVFDSCRLYWLTCQPLISDPMERELLCEPLCALLELCVPLLGGRQGGGSEAHVVGPPSREKDYELITHLYSTVFQAHIDKCCWKEGLALVEDALWNTPKPIHAQLITYKLVFKSRMGKSVEGDLIRFQEEPSDFVASLWHKAAMNATNPTHTITAYQNAIDTLQSENSWQKIEYLLEFAEWLYTQNFPDSNPINQLERIIALLLNPPNEPENSTGGFKSMGVRQLEVLIRVHIMMALLHGRGSTDHRKLSVVAVGFCNELWKVLIGTSGFPASVLEWSTHTLSSELMEKIKAGTGENALNMDTVYKPMLTLHYLSELVEALLFCELHPLALPVLKLQLVIAETVVELSRPLCQLYEMRLTWLCQELGLSVTSSPLELPDPEDLANAQVEIELYQAKKAAVEKEESKRSLDSKPSLSKSVKSTQVVSDQNKDSVSALGHCIEETVILRKAWVDLARLLIQQGEYQLARDLLNQAMLSSQVFKDQHTCLLIHILSARLAFLEGNQQKAIKLITQAQKYDTSLSEWLEGILLLSKTIRASGDYQSQLRPVLEHAVSKLEKLKSSTNKASVLNRLEHAIVTIRTRLSLSELGDSVHDVSVTMDSVAALSEGLMDCTKTLLNIGYSKEAACIATQHASYLRSLGCSKLNENEAQFKEWLLEAISLSDRAVNILQEVLKQTLLLCQPSEDISLPIQRELIKAQFLLADLLMDAFSHHSAQRRREQSEMRNKSSIQKLIEDFVKEEPILTLMQEEWQNTVQTGLERGLSLLTSAHTLCHNDKNLKTKVMAGLGRCLGLLSTHTRPDPALQWSDDYCAVKTTADTLDPTSDKEDSPELQEKKPKALSGPKYGALSSVMKMKEAEVAECDESSSLLYLTQVCPTLMQAVSTAIRNKQLDVAIQASLELVDCCGGFDSRTASLYLALFQSLSVSVKMESILRQVLADPLHSKLGALLKQSQRLATSQAASKHNDQELQTFEAYKMLKVSDNHLDLLKHFPAHFRFLVLQHSQDGSHLYAAYLVPPQPPPPGPKKGQPPSIAECLDPVVSCAQVNQKDLNGVLDMMHDFEASQYQKFTKSKSQQDESESLLKDVIAGMESYLFQVMKLMGEAFRREKSDRELNIIVLADTLLLHLPLEVLNVFQANNIQSVTRDFSLQMLFNRLEKFNESVSQPENSKDTKKKGEKYHPQPENFLANVANFKYVFDPRKEFEGTDSCSDIMHLIQQFPKITSKWSGYNAGEQAMSVSEWTTLLKGASGFIFFGPEKLLAHLPSSNLAPLSLQDCSIAMVMDRVHTTQSILHQSKLDFHKSEFELRCEESVETAMLLSLVGVRCLLYNQWTTSLGKNLDTTTNILKELLSEGNTIGKLNWARIHSPFHTPLVKVEEEVAADCKLNLNSAEDEDETGEIPAESSQEETDSVEYSSIFNTIVYGLPHINLIAT